MFLLRGEMFELHLIYQVDGGNKTEGAGKGFQFQDYPPRPPFRETTQCRKAFLLFDMPSFVRLMLSFTGLMCSVKATTWQVLSFTRVIHR